VAVFYLENMRTVVSYLTADSSLYGFTAPNWVAISAAVGAVCMIIFAPQLGGLMGRYFDRK